MKYLLSTGHDHLKNCPLYNVVGLDNEYVGEWHTEKEDAEKEYAALAVSFENYTELPAAVKEWFKLMQKQAVIFDMRQQSAHEMNQGKDDLQVNPETHLTFDQAVFIDSEIQLAKLICKQSRWNFNKLYDYHPPTAGMYAEVYPMINLSEDEATLCTSEHNREPDFYDLLVRGETLEHVYFEIEDIKPHRIDAVIRGVCNRFNCDFETVNV